MTALGKKCLWLACLAAMPLLAEAQVQPSASAVLIEKGQKEATIDLKNNSDEAVLLYSKVSKLPDDDLDGGVLYTVPQTVVVAPGKNQTVRVIYRGNKPLDREHIARVLFSGLPPQEQAAGKVKFVIGQDLPVVIGVDPNVSEVDTWKLITFKQAQGKLCMSNPSRKVFRFDPNMSSAQTKTDITFNKAYVLPGETLCQALKSPLAANASLTFNSVSSFNFMLQTHVIQLSSQASNN
ncbi:MULTISPECIES: fimbria/pilus periplasmic chaperone [unclassified Pseudomonas]|uniref:fimbria/pilus periplasmic chaperone n=1 Tax=unclassified Pseudomonas TaxID=196821 RepID=UPI001F5720D1|nr:MULTISPECIES: fimbria/pilus periplasmic chaperone [unclassified Pseudomonas]